MSDRSFNVGIYAIETLYKGYRFRSRLEARWAVFFDYLGVAWEYEPQGYVLGDGSRYLPDFWLPDLKYWIEIKPGKTDSAGNFEWPADGHGGQIGWLCGQPLGATAFVLVGSPGWHIDSRVIDMPGGAKRFDLLVFDYEGFLCETANSDDMRVGAYTEGVSVSASACDNYHHWCICPVCGAIGIQYQGRSARLTCRRTEGSPCFVDSDREHTDEDERILAALIVAKQARFEHGESGAPNAVAYSSFTGR
jgi:hypothetical protein